MQLPYLIVTHPTHARVGKPLSVAQSTHFDRFSLPLPLFAMGFLDSLKQGPSAKTWKAPTEADRQFEIATKRIEEQQEWNQDRAKERQRRVSRF